jgi:hypothetical protein
MSSVDAFVVFEIFFILYPFIFPVSRALAVRRILSVQPTHQRNWRRKIAIGEQFLSSFSAP